MKTILLKFDEKIFQRLKADKIKKENYIGKTLRWEEYVELLRGLSQTIKA